MDRLFSQLLSSFGIVIRTFRAYFTRQFAGVRARFRRLTSFSRQAAKAIPKVAQSAALATKKPSKREDYIETSRMFISKSMIVLLLLTLIVLGILFYYVVWPWLLSEFFTAHKFHQAPDVSSYTGKVVLYYDAEKTRPMLRGRLTKGVLSGEGEAFDENGRLVYSGGYKAGKYEGEGQLYEQGELVYKGGFVSGLYEDASASQYAKSGALIYKGGFSEGKRSGTGEEYYESGEIKFRGRFSNDLYDQQGTLYPEEGVSIEATFEKGLPTGRARIYRDKRLYYEGEVDGLVPDGLGTLYAADGTAVYTGRISQGKLDGAQLIGVPTDEARGLFGDAPLKETRGPRSGFAVHNAPLGMTLFCTFKTSAADPRVFTVYLYDQGADEFFDLIPWETAAAYERWCRESGHAEAKKRTAGFEAPVFPNGLPFEKREYYKSAYSYEDYGIALWSLSEGGELFMVEWLDLGYLPEAPSGGSKTESGERMETLLGRLKLVPPVTGGGEAPSEYSAAGGPAVEPSRGAAGEGGGVAVRPLSPAQVEAVASCMLDCLEQTEIRAALEDQLILKQELLTLEREALSMDRGSQEAVEALESEVEAVQLAVNRCVVGLSKAELSLLKAGGGALADYELKKALFVADPALILAAQASAAVTGGEGAQTDPMLKLAMMELELSYELLLQSISQYDRLKQRGEALQADYAVGAATDGAILRAACDACDAAMKLITQLCAYSKQMLTLNTMTNGWLAASLGWELAA